MSVVSGVTLQVADEGDAKLVRSLVDPWLEKNGYERLGDLGPGYRGSKHPQIFVFGAGYNYFDDDGFADLIRTLTWSLPECVVLLINPKEGATKVVRP